MDQIFYNGKIITMNATDEVQERRTEPQAILIREGKIKMVGRSFLISRSVLNRQCIEEILKENV